MQKSTLGHQIVRGMVAGIGAGIVQVVIGKAEEKLLPLPRHEDADIAPRLVGRLAETTGTKLPDREKWILGTLFHFGYAAFWGAGYAAAVRDEPVPPVASGTLLGGLIYLIAFPNWGVAVKTKTERPVEKRTKRMHIVTWSVALSYGVATGLFYHWSKPKH